MLVAGTPSRKGCRVLKEALEGEVLRGETGGGRLPRKLSGWCPRNSLTHQFLTNQVPGEATRSLVAFPAERHWARTQPRYLEDTNPYLGRTPAAQGKNRN